MKNPAAAYSNSREHLLAEIGYVELLLRDEVDRFKGASPDQREILRGVFISDREIAEILAGLSQPERETDSPWREAAATLRAEIDERRQASAETGVSLSLPRLANIFGLTQFEEQLLVLCLAPEIDLRYQRVYAYLQDDVTRTEPGVDLALRLLCSTDQERVGARGCFSASAPLFRAQMFRQQDADHHPLTARSLVLDERIVDYLVGIDRTSREFAACCRPLNVPAEHLWNLRWPDDFKKRLLEIIRSQVEVFVSNGRRLIFHFHGPEGTGKRSLAAALCAEAGIRLLVVDLAEVAGRAQNFEESLKRIAREALLQPAAICFTHSDRLSGDEAGLQSRWRSVANAIGEFSWLTFVSTEKSWEPGGLFGDHVFL
ncbi:MAG TPA: AAA family ATPase, partial [Blastocatellia bacterium]|nr:AAA family ATPase [Blastocatellia bacterium]